MRSLASSASLDAVAVARGHSATRPATGAWRRGSSSAARWCSRWSSSAASPASRTRACRSSSGSRSSARCRRCRKRSGSRRSKSISSRPEYQLVNKGMGLDEFKLHLLVGILAPAARTADRRRLSRSVPVVHRAARHSPGPCVETLRHLRAGRTAGRDGLVHGEERPRRRSARVAVPADRTPRARARHLLRRCSGSRFRSSRPRRAPTGVRGRSLRRWAHGIAALDLRDDALRRLRRRHPGRIRLQHLSADERPCRAAGDLLARALVAKLLLEHGDRPVRPPADRVAHRVRSCRRSGGSSSRAR